MLHNGQTRVLIIASEFPPDAGGIGNHAFNLAVHLSEKKFPVTVLADIVHTSTEQVKNVDGFKNFHFVPVRRNKIVFLTYGRRIKKSLALTRKNDVIILSGKFPLWCTRWLRTLYPQKKFLAVVHGTELQHPFINFNLAGCNCIIAVSAFTRSLISSSVLRKVNSYVIPNGINLDEFTGLNTASQRKPDLTKLQLITVGSVTERKGQENVINALPAILKKFPGACYHIVGKPVLQQKLQRQIDKNNLHHHVIFHGVVDRRSLIELLNKADIKLMLSNNTASGDVEGFGIAILEANALGIPAIGSKNTGIEDAIKDGETGILVDPKNISEIVDAIEQILSNYNLFSRNARQWASQHDWKIIINQYIDAIGKLF